MCNYKHGTDDNGARHQDDFAHPIDKKKRAANLQQLEKGIAEATFVTSF